MDVLLYPFLNLVYTVLSLYTWCLVLAAILTWLVYFNVINSYNPLIRMMGQFLYQITEPLLRPIRRFMPASIGLDLSPVVLILLIGFIQNVITRVLIKLSVSM